MDWQEDRTTEDHSMSRTPVISGTDLILRPYRDTDANRVLALMREVFIDEMGWNRAFLADTARALVEIHAVNAGPGNLFLLCYSRRKIVGIVTLFDAGGGTGFIRWLVVHRDARGIGLGRLLLCRALEFARDAGFARVRLVTVRDLARAFDFYLKAGFSEVGTRPDILWQMPHNLCFMELEVAP
jgi:ribosomal protein S18 acetylase RimI-like enzyme